MPHGTILVNTTRYDLGATWASLGNQDLPARKFTAVNTPTNIQRLTEVFGVDTTTGQKVWMQVRYIGGQDTSEVWSPHAGNFDLYYVGIVGTTTTGSAPAGVLDSMDLVATEKCIGVSIETDGNVADDLDPIYVEYSEATTDHWIPAPQLTKSKSVAVTQTGG